MRSFKPYLLAAAAFAIGLTLLALNEGIATFFGQFEALVFIPIIMSILVSGNVHVPSMVGVYLGFFIQWFILGLAIGAVVWGIRRR
ncbi:MAG TPA: hypothetical protein VGJ74_17980 [Burkholderiales bacterium]